MRAAAACADNNAVEPAEEPDAPAEDAVEPADDADETADDAVETAQPEPEPSDSGVFLCLESIPIGDAISIIIPQLTTQTTTGI